MTTKLGVGSVGRDRRRGARIDARGSGEVVANLAGDIETRVRDWRVGRRTSNN